MWTKRQILNGILYQLKNGCNWADLPKDFPPYSTVFWHYKQWCENDILDKIMTELHGRVREQVKKKPQWTTLIMIDKKARHKPLALDMGTSRQRFQPPSFLSSNESYS